MLGFSTAYLISLIHSLISSTKSLNLLLFKSLTIRFRPLRYILMTCLAFISLIYLPLKVLNIYLTLSRSKKNYTKMSNHYSSEASMFALIDNYDLISFDIFDTAILRDIYNPRDLFAIIERCYGIERFSLIRTEAEIVALKSASMYGRKDTTLHEIYCNIHLPEKEKIMEIEMDMEFDFCVPNPFIKRIIDNSISKGKKIVFTSDIYMHDADIIKILEKCGYIDYEKVYVSSSGKYCKRDGSAYNEICKDFQLDPSRIVHIGDNKYSDYKMARSMGMNAIHYKKVAERNPMLFESKNNIFSAIHNGIVCNSLAEPRPFFLKLGMSIVGPLYLAFINWINTETHKDRIEKIFFLSRDGYIASKAYSSFFGGAVKYLCVSRLVIRRALLNIDKVEPSLIFTPELQGHTIVDFCKKLIPDFKEDELAGTIFEGKIIQSELMIHYSELIKILKSNHMDYINTQHDLLIGYLVEAGLADCERAGIVDVGWNGSIQDGIQCLLRNNGISTHLFGYYVGIADSQTTRERNDRCNMRGFGFFLEQSPFSTELIEKVFVAPHGTITGYALINGRIEPSLDENSLEAINYQHYCELEQGILYYITKMKKYNKYEVTNISKTECLNCMERLTKAPLYEEIRNMMELVHGDIFYDKPQDADYYWRSTVLHQKLLAIIDDDKPFLAHSSRNS